MGCMFYEGRTPLIRIDGNLNHQKYFKILEEQLIPFSINCHGSKDNIIFQQDGCEPHIAKAVLNYSEN